MAFNTIGFGVFMLVVLVVYYAIRRNAQWLWLLTCSVAFYVWSQPLLLLVPVAMTVITYATARAIESAGVEKKRQLLFIIATSVQVGILVFYKYLGFFINSFVDAGNWLKGTEHETTQGFFSSLAVPMGISYILFQAIGYLVEVKNGEMAAEKNIISFSAYLLFFPKIVSGPVERAEHFLPQLRSPVFFSYGKVTEGIRLFAWGLFKKLIIAERLSFLVNHTYGDLHASNTALLWISFLVYPIQMYTDFSGYTDMALGLAKMLGFEMKGNFNQPFSAQSMVEFWRRWHMSLSTWFNDYFYMPLAIKTRDWGKWSMVFASMLTFLVLGLWHGASWTYVWFGGINGLFISFEFLTTRSRKKIRKRIAESVNSVGGRVYVFLAFALVLVFFRATRVGDAFYLITHLFTGKIDRFSVQTGLQQVGLSAMDYIICLITVPLLFYVERAGLLSVVGKAPQWVRWGVYYLFFSFLVTYGVSTGAGFIYQRF